MISFLFVCCLTGSERSGLKISVHLLLRLAFKSRRRGAENEGEAVASMDNLERSASLSILKIFKNRLTGRRFFHPYSMLTGFQGVLMLEERADSCSSLDRLQ